jgi:hypothetical protein
MTRWPTPVYAVFPLLLAFFSNLAAAHAAIHTDLRRDSALIVAASSANQQAIRLAAGIREAGCAEAAIKDDGVTSVQGRPLILLGNAVENRLLRKLYFEDYDFADLAFPGAGNAAVRTIPDPLESGADVVVVEASDGAGLSLAVDVFLREVRKAGCELSFMNRVVAGPGGRIEEPYARQLDPSYDWAATMAGAGSWDYMRAIAQFAVGYLKSGKEEYLPGFRDHLRNLYRKRFAGQTAEVQIHGFIYWLVNTWDLIRDHPFFNQDRHEIDEMLLSILRSGEGPRRIAKMAERYDVRQNHYTRAALDGYFGGRWAWRRYQLAEGKEWMDLAARLFAPQLYSSKPEEDSWGHQWNASLLNVVTYALASGDREYFRSRALRDAAMRALIAHSNREMGPHMYLAAVAAGTGDPRYLSLTKAVDPALSPKSFQPALGGSDEFLRAFDFYRDAPFHPDAAGVAIAPLDRLWFDHPLAPIGAFENTVPFADTFDKIAFREGWRNEDFYLLFDGVSGGSHSFLDANCIKRYAEGGVDWFTTAGGEHSVVTVRSENGVYLAMDGAGPGKAHRFAKKLYAESRGDYMFVGAVLTGLGGVDWERHIVRRKGRWTVVIDRALPRRAGELLMERHWWLKPEIHAQGAGIVSQAGSAQHPVFLHLQSFGAQESTVAGPLRAREPSQFMERLRSVSQPGATLEMGALIYVDAEPVSARWKIRHIRSGWLVEGDEERLLIGVETSGSGAIPEITPLVTADDPAVEPPVAQKPPFAPMQGRWTTSRLPGRITVIEPAAGGWAAGDGQGHVVWTKAGGELGFRAKRPQPISALHYYPGGKNADAGLCVAEDDGTLSLLNLDGSIRWSVNMPWIPPQWAYWTEGRSRAREIDHADLDGDGTPEILAANGDRHLYAFNAQGRQLFRAPVEWGGLTAMNVASIEGQLRILGGTSRPTAYGRILSYDARGEHGRSYERNDLGGTFPAETKDMRVADLNRDGKPEILAALNTTLRQLIAYREDGHIAWEADVAGGAGTVALSPGRIFCATGAGYLMAFNSEGTREWSLFLGEPAQLIAIGGDNIEAITTHDVFRLDQQGRPIGRVSLPAALTAVPRPGDHRTGERFLLGLEDGTILARE